ncbi:MAG TPA: hypothetical protein VEO18_05910 [Thermoplasmata archaeon]|nr:hypothetical protein [Thermoplasmata archaeon]
MRKSRTLRVERDFALSRANFRSWADDVRDSVLPFFEAVNATPLLCTGKGVPEKARRALARSFRRRGERVNFAATIPRARAVALDLAVESGLACRSCGEAAKSMSSRVAFIDASGKVAQFDARPRTTVAVCPACGTPAEPDMEENGPAEGPGTPEVAHNSGENDEVSDGLAALREIDEL